MAKGIIRRRGSTTTVSARFEPQCTFLVQVVLRCCTSKQQEELPGGVEPGKIRYHSMPIDIRWRVLRSSFHSVAWPCTFKISSGAEFVVAQKGRCPILFRCKAQGRLAIAMRCMHRGKRRGRARSKRAPHHGPLPFLGESESSAVSEMPIVGANALFATISTWRCLW